MSQSVGNLWVHCCDTLPSNPTLQAIKKLIKGTENGNSNSTLSLLESVNLPKIRESIKKESRTDAKSPSEVLRTCDSEESTWKGTTPSTVPYVQVMKTSCKLDAIVHLITILESTWELMNKAQNPEMQLLAQMSTSVQLSIFVHRGYDIYRTNSERISTQ